MVFKFLIVYGMLLKNKQITCFVCHEHFNCYGVLLINIY